MDYFVDDNKPKFVIEYCHVHGKSNKSESDVETSEGMDNDAYSCWLISVVQALRASPSFRVLFSPSSHERNSIKKELFHLFDIVEGRHGEKQRLVKYDEIRNFKKHLIKEGLEAKMNDGFLEEPFLKFLLKKLHAREFEYSHLGKLKNATILNIPLKKEKKQRQLQTFITDQKVTFRSKSKTPEFLPIYLDRPQFEHKYDKDDIVTEFARTPVVPNGQLEIVVGNTGEKAKYRLVSVVIGRDSIEHAYCYVVERDSNGDPVWVEYNDHKVLIHTDPETKKRNKSSNLTPLVDACKHAGILIYQFIGFT